jgi:hypothetical protein
LRGDETTGGEKFEVTPGEAVHVPLMWPHRVKNRPEPSASFSITWNSDWIYQEADVRGMNHLLRRFGMNPRPPAPFPQRNMGKALAYMAIRKARRIGA